MADPQKEPKAELAAFRVLALVVLLVYVPLVALTFWSFWVAGPFP